MRHGTAGVGHHSCPASALQYPPVPRASGGPWLSQVCEMEREEFSGRDLHVV